MRQLIQNNSALSQLPAVRKNQIYFVDEIVQEIPFTVSCLSLLRSLLHHGRSESWRTDAVCSRWCSSWLRKKTCPLEIYLFFAPIADFSRDYYIADGRYSLAPCLAWNKQRFLGGAWQWNPLLDERLPRLIVIVCTGASLAVSGAVMQALFHNPLASPSVLGITAGGSLLVVITFILGMHIDYPFFFRCGFCRLLFDTFYRLFLFTQ